ncbi:MAG: type II toxin-antitoxin system Phd/YefM family antitoxin [Gemmatimonadales bacterium]|jgi:prevent-host-death family protein
MNIREFRARLSDALGAVAAGEEVVVTRRGTAVARLVPAAQKPKRLPSFAALRSSVGWRGDSAVNELVRMRREDRF